MFKGVYTAGHPFRNGKLDEAYIALVNAGRLESMACVPVAVRVILYAFSGCICVTNR